MTSRILSVIGTVIVFLLLSMLWCLSGKDETSTKPAPPTVLGRWDLTVHGSEGDYPAWLIVSIFEGGRDPEDFAAVAATVPGLLVCVAAYSVVESVNLTFAFALRGAGDTKFVTMATFCLAWPIMVLPTYLVVRAGGSVYWAWWFATAHIFAMAACFFLRFRTGKWKTMRVIELQMETAP